MTTVLVIDDSSTFRAYLRNGLQDAGYRVLAAESGEQGLALAQSGDIHAFIVDNVLPGIDGASVIRRLRQQVRHRRTPSLLLTASADPRQELNALEAGADAFVHKDESMDVLLARLASILRSVGSSVEEPTPHAYRRAPSVLLLNAELSWSNRLAESLRLEGVQVRILRGDTLPEGPFDCIVLGVQTVADSAQLVARLGKRDLPRAPRLVLVGQSHNRSELVEAIALGADDYLHASAGEEVMTARLHAQLRRKQLEDENETTRENFLRHRMELENQIQLAAAREANAQELRVARDLAEEKAHEAENLLAQNEAVFHSMADGLIIMDLHGKIVQVNQAALDIFALPAAQLERALDLRAGLSEFRTLAGEALLPVDWPLARAARGISISNLELEFTCFQPYRRFLGSFSAVPVNDSQGNRILAVLTFRDITDLKRSQERLRRTEQLAVTGRLAASIAHEINNPLSAVMNLLYLAERQVLNDPEAAALLDKAQKELRRVAEITRQTLAFYRDSTHPLETDVCALVSEIAEVFSTKLEEAQIHLRLDLACSARPRVYPGELRQAISNLFSNAIDASPPGATLRIRVRSAHSSETAGVRISVADQGPGIPASFYPEIFKPFASLKATQGTGLGLWITQSIMARHGGSIRFRSRTAAPSGTVFSLFFPLSPAQTPRADTLGKLFRDLGNELLASHSEAAAGR